MSLFFDVHQRAIDRAFAMTDRPGDHFYITLDEPFGEVMADPMHEIAVVIDFVRVANNRYHVASEGSKKAIADWIERHKDTPLSAWELPIS